MSKKLLLVLFLSFSIMVAALFGCGRHSSSEKPSTSTVLSITNGDVFIMKAHTTTWVKAQAGVTLEADDTIKAGDGSWAVITFFEGSTIELEPGTEVSVATLNITDTGSTTISLKQEAGRTVSRVNKLADPASSYEVSTQTAVAAVRGSVMLVDVAENGTTIVGNGEGSIVVIAQGVEVQIPQGMQSVVAIGQQPSVPEQGLPFVPSGVVGNTVSIITSAGVGGSISPSGSVTVSNGADQTFTITPNAHYHIVDVLVDDVSVGAVTSYTFSSASANHIISTTFAIDTYAISTGAGTHGSITPLGNVTVNYSGNQTFTISPDINYYVMDVLVDDISVGAVTSYTFNNVSANHTISASFATDLIVDTNMALEAGEYTFRNVIVTNNATLTLNSNSSLSGFQGVKINAENVTIDSGSSILSDGNGFGTASGSGAGSGTGRGGGGGYGGQGGADQNGDPGGGTYGSAEEPVDSGSGGSNPSGGAGGGAIRLNVSDTLTNNGIISANGVNQYIDGGGSGGSGGSIYVTTQTLAGSGSFTANGGNSCMWSGGGGGGRIAIYYETSSFNGTVEANGGTGYRNGQNGTVVLFDGVLDPANGHYYELVTESIDWTDARDAAASREFAGLRGHLATITSGEENLWLTSTFTADALHYHWIGGYQLPDSSEPDGGWTWVTGEPWSFSNWWPDEPNNDGGNEDSILFDHGVLPETGKSWNDVNGATLADGYLVEYDNDWYVNPGESIQPAIDAAAAAGGGTVYVAAGTYYELISLRSGVVVQGAGANVTTIDGSNSGTVVTALGVDTTARLEDFTISHGSGSSGGGMRNEGSSPVVTNCTFSGNSATEGAGILCRSSSSPTITNCIINNNSASWSGGGIECDYSSSSTINNCIISHNSAIYGGGMQCNEASPVVINCIIINNTSNNGGGGINNDDASSTFINCIITENNGPGGGLHSGDTHSSVTAVNCIIWGNTVCEVSVNPTCYLSITYSDVHGGYSGTGNINQDPLLTSDFHLQAGSPCIDMGNNAAVPSGITTDFEGNPRIMDGNGDGTAIVDMGADEY